MTVIANPANNGLKDEFEAYEWYRNDIKIDSVQSYYAGTGNTIPAGTYYVRVKVKGFKTVWEESCDTVIAEPAVPQNAQRSLLVKQDKEFYVEANIGDELLAGAELVVYNTAGSVIANVKLSGRRTYIDSRLASSGHIFVLIAKNGLKTTLRKVTVE
jgi:hypothetical protein